MDANAKTIPIQSATAVPGCGDCLHGAGSAPACRALQGEALDPPRLSGPGDELQRLLAGLAPALGFGDGQGAGIVRALQVLPGEVDLQLAVSRHCGGALLADAAFQTLRGLLPDTDIYVTTAD